MKLLRVLAPLVAALVASNVMAYEVEEETKTIDELYADAVAEGGKLVVYHGGDIPTQQDTTANAFRAAFPKVNLTMVVDYSKYHDVRIDNQLETDSLVPDVVALQTLQDFTRWAKEDKLLKYKPKGFSEIYEPFKDESGAWMSHTCITFSYFYDEALLNGTAPPQTPAELVDPKYANLIASSYPHDDDAALFIYARYAEKYGWDWVKKLAAQKPEFKRGSNSPAVAVSQKRKAIGIAGSAAANTTVKRGNGTDFLTWGQRIAVLKDAKRPAAAKLFMSWILSKEVQSTMMAGRSTRKDVIPSTGVYPWEVEGASTDLFPKFMEDRAKVEQLKATFALYFGEVTGEPSPGQLGLYPVAMESSENVDRLPHFASELMPSASKAANDRRMTRLRAERVLARALRLPTRGEITKVPENAGEPAIGLGPLSRLLAPQARVVGSVPTPASSSHDYYLQQSGIKFLLEDLVKKLQEDRPEQVSAFISTYFASVVNGTHIRGREFEYINGALINRVAFLGHLERIANAMAADRVVARLRLIAQQNTFLIPPLGDVESFVFKSSSFKEFCGHFFTSAAIASAINELQDAVTHLRTHV
ncbi:hypothetical protein Poli38472_006798 [Pythium oligandrum]|uniref:Uncharacterized protein n=1 Tax=Pythium oligandrum TaxID=41045 RepID=A0A8K1FFG6_PYTOL|nr:hypothetical protein Poli38472_006798 [Pythium oligandrum]|eukprot:TMW56788.1 hypothetical protein Poli38472_006798 [Pythium oligandrum]